MVSQNERVLDYIEKFGSITQMEAINSLGIMRLASRVSELRMMGVPIEREMVTVHNRFGEDASIARYRIAGEMPESVKAALQW